MKKQGTLLLLALLMLLSCCGCEMRMTKQGQVHALQIRVAQWNVSQRDGYRYHLQTQHGRQATVWMLPVERRPLRHRTQAMGVARKTYQMLVRDVAAAGMTLTVAVSDAQGGLCCRYPAGHPG